jgi:CRP-like cAMP-binding protein
MTRHGLIDEQLSQVPLFRGLTKRQLRMVSSIVSRIDGPPGKVLAKKGRPGHEFIIVLEGEVEVRDGDRVLATRGPGEYVGEIALINVQPRTADVVAKTAVIVDVMSSQEFQGLLGEIPELSEQIRATVAERLAALEAVPVS